MSECICQIALQTPFTGHVLALECDEPEWPDHQERLRGMGYEQFGDERRMQPIDRRTLRVVSQWLRYDRPGDSWWEDSMALNYKVLDWLHSER